MNEQQWIKYTAITSRQSGATLILARNVSFNCQKVLSAPFSHVNSDSFSDLEKSLRAGIPQVSLQSMEVLCPMEKKHTQETMLQQRPSTGECAILKNLLI